MRFNLNGFIRSRAAMLLVGALLVLSGASIASAQETISGDLRINQVAHFGGDALYCVDANIIATTSYPLATTVGGFRLLNSNGQELWFVPAADLQAAIDESIATGKGILVGQGQGTYGPATLYTYFNGITQVFEFAGYDEYAKPNSLTFNLCTPVGPNPEAPGSAEELCTLVQLNLKPKLMHSKVNSFIPSVSTISTQVPCDTCPDNTSKLAHKIGDRWSIPFFPYCVEFGNPNSIG